MPNLVIDPLGAADDVQAVDPASAPNRRRAPWQNRVAFPTGSDALLFVAVLAFAAGILNALSSAFSVDSWLELVAGRDVLHGGIPHVETLTLMSHGARWVDQQWLSQMISYVLYRIGGLGFLGVVNVGMMAASLGAAVFYARRRGARAWIVLLMFGLCLWQIIPAREVRTQAFAMPLLVATLILLSTDSRQPSRRIYWCLPLLILWANLHGTVSIGAALVSLRGMTLAWERRDQLKEAGRMRARMELLQRPLILTTAPLLTLFITPYGLETFTYYRATLANSALKHAVTEWAPITSVWAEAVPFFLLAGITIWSFGRRPERTTTWEKLALLALAAGSIATIRNSMLFAFAALIIVPIALEGIPSRRAPRGAPVRHRLNRGLCWAVLSVLVLSTIVSVLRPDRDFEYHYERSGVLAAVVAARNADPSLRILTDVRFADWLLWRDPALRGSVASDARFELLSAPALTTLQRVFSADGPDWKQGARGYGLLLMDRSAEPGAVKGFLQEPGNRVLYNDGIRIVILRSAAQAA